MTILTLSPTDKQTLESSLYNLVRDNNDTATLAGTALLAGENVPYADLLELGNCIINELWACADSGQTWEKNFTLASENLARRIIAHAKMQRESEYFARLVTQIMGE
jgi:hypothetical protein